MHSQHMNILAILLFSFFYSGTAPGTLRKYGLVIKCMPLYYAFGSMSQNGLLKFDFEAAPTCIYNRQKRHGEYARLDQVRLPTSQLCLETCNAIGNWLVKKFLYKLGLENIKTSQFPYSLYRHSNLSDAEDEHCSVQCFCNLLVII